MQRINALSRNDAGVALITALLVTMVTASLGVAAVQVSVHVMSSSANNRSRTESIHAAEAGINSTLATIAASPGALPCSLTFDLAGEPPIRYVVNVDYYDTDPPSSTPMACPPSTAPVSAEISSTGRSRRGGVDGGIVRTMKSLVRLDAQYGAYDQAIFSQQSGALETSLTINGENGNDGNLYTNGNFSCQQVVNIKGSIIAQGTVTLNCGGSRIAQDVWGKGNVVIGGSTSVANDTTSSAGTININNTAVRVTRNATASGTITLANSANVAGAVRANTASPSPPTYSFPTYTYDPSAWTAAGYTIKPTYSTCAAAETALTANTSTAKQVFRIAPFSGCRTLFTGGSGGGATVNVYNDLAIVMDGGINPQNNLTFRSIGGRHNIYLLTPGATCPDATQGSTSSGNYEFSSGTTFVDLYVMLQTPCNILMSSNTLGVGGQIFTNLGFKNGQAFSMDFHQVLVPGTSVIGFRTDVQYIRE